MQWTAERVALWLAVIFVGTNLLYAGLRIREAIDERKVDYSGELMVDEILWTHHPHLFDKPIRFAPGYAYLSDGDGTLTVPEAKPAAIAIWSVLRIAPWLLA